MAAELSRGGESGKGSSHLARIRDNQRRSRARRKEYLSELEEKFRKCEQLGVEATLEMQIAARQVLEENARLRDFLRRSGYTEEEVNASLGLGETAENLPSPAYTLGSQPVSAASDLQHMLDNPKPCCQEGKDCEKGGMHIHSTSDSSPAPSLKLNSETKIDAVPGLSQSARPRVRGESSAPLHDQQVSQINTGTAGNFGIERSFAHAPTMLDGNVRFQQYSLDDAAAMRMTSWSLPNAQAASTKFGSEDGHSTIPYNRQYTDMFGNPSLSVASPQALAAFQRAQISMPDTYYADGDDFEFLNSGTALSHGQQVSFMNSFGSPQDSMGFGAAPHSTLVQHTTVKDQTDLVPPGQQATWITQRPGMYAASSRHDR